jgi:transposase-like protein
MSEDYPRTVLEFERRFPDDAACRGYLFALRWPKGFVCPHCSGQAAWAMKRGLWLCRRCRRQVSVTAGTVFQDSHLPLTVWFRALWHMAGQKNGVSALGLQAVLGLGSYKVAWAMLHKLRRAMVRPGRDRLTGRVEVDETYIGGLNEGQKGRPTAGQGRKALVVIAAQEDGAGIGRIRMRRIARASAKELIGFVEQAVEPPAVVRTDGWNAYSTLWEQGYRHEVVFLKDDATLMPRVHRVASLLKRWLLGTHQGAVRPEHLDDYLDEFTFRFNRRTSASRGKLFYRLAQQAVQVKPTPYRTLIRPQPLGGG